MKARSGSHIPHLKTITQFYRQLQIGEPQGDDFSIMRIEDQPYTKRVVMPLFRCNFYRVVLLVHSKVDWNLPSEIFSASENCIYFGYPGKLESWVAPQQNQGFLVCFTADFAHIDPLSPGFDQLFPYFNFQSLPLLELTSHESDSIKPLASMMLNEICSPHADKLEMIRYQLHQYLIAIRRIYAAKANKQSDQTKSNVAIYNRFRQALDEYFGELTNGDASTQPSVSLLADRLHISASYLNTVIKGVTGSTASNLIQEKTILEAKSYLMHTDLQVAEISHKLGFSNISYFNRFFKRLTSDTPLSFKRATT
ncbi:MAG: AraC family transcriptional regulator [Cyclobacteriaceae bacterium]|nr:AraC family transcriptional regulator [Cyclobacteriaceae bacterium HetDA_MAG_MS6]